MEPVTNVEEAKRAIESFERGPEDFALPISDGMQDQVGMKEAPRVEAVVLLDEERAEAADLLKVAHP
ncbi:MAG TPA: hypothetical protein VIQ24_20210 [Pyrinomonadaceae bacterium]